MKISRSRTALLAAGLTGSGLCAVPIPAYSTTDWDCVSGGTRVWFERGERIGRIFEVYIDGKEWRRYPGHQAPKHLPLRQQAMKVENSTVVAAYADALTGEEVLRIDFTDVRPGQFESDRGILTIKDEGSWQVTCSND